MKYARHCKTLQFDIKLLTNLVVLFRSSSFRSFPATCAPGIGFQNQCAHWWRKQFRKSVSRPEIPENFRLTQSTSYALKNPSGFFDAMNLT
jgi:hypothetical protein